MNTHFSGGFQNLGFWGGKGLFLSWKNSLTDLSGWRKPDLTGIGHGEQGTGEGGILYMRGIRSITGWL